MGTSPAAWCRCCWNASITCALHWGYLQAAPLQRCLESLVMGSLPLLCRSPALQHPTPFCSHASAGETCSLVQDQDCLVWDGGLILSVHHSKAAPICTPPLWGSTALGMSPGL